MIEITGGARTLRALALATALLALATARAEAAAFLTDTEVRSSPIGRRPRAD